MPRDPQTLGEWQLAADAASFMLTLDAARQYGLVEGGPEVDVARAWQILEGARRRGIFPAPIQELCRRMIR